MVSRTDTETFARACCSPAASVTLPEIAPPAASAASIPAVVWPAAWFMEGLARLTGIPPMMTRDHLKMARKKMFYSSAKAMRELGYQSRPARRAVEDAVAWFRANGMLAG